MMARESTAALSVENLGTVLDTDSGLVRAVDALSLSIERGETFALVGESGCGKSMTALSILRLLPDNGRVDAGRVSLAGIEVTSLPESRMRDVRGRRVSIIFQEPATSLNPVLRVGDQIVEVIERHTALNGAAARERALQWLRRVGLPEAERRIDSYPFELSGGQKQRVMIAIALAAEPDVLIAMNPAALKASLSSVGDDFNAWLDNGTVKFHPEKCALFQVPFCQARRVPRADSQIHKALRKTCHQSPFHNDWKVVRIRVFNCQIHPQMKGLS